MRMLSPATRQKLAILLKSKNAANGSALSPNLQPPPPANSLKLPKPPVISSPMADNAEKMNQPMKFTALRNKFKKY